MHPSFLAGQQTGTAEPGTVEWGGRGGAPPIFLKF